MASFQVKGIITINRRCTFLDLTAHYVEPQHRSGQLSELSPTLIVSHSVTFASKLTYLDKLRVRFCNLTVRRDKVVFNMSIEMSLPVNSDRSIRSVSSTQIAEASSSIHLFCQNLTTWSQTMLLPTILAFLPLCFAASSGTILELLPLSLVPPHCLDSTSSP
jgi:hypothetical protein